jgi:hypothetical protein
MRGKPSGEEKDRTLLKDARTRRLAFVIMEDFGSKMRNSDSAPSTTPFETNKLECNVWNKQSATIELPRAPHTAASEVSTVGVAEDEGIRYFVIVISCRGRCRLYPSISSK